jgi:hypothetical protein
MHQLERPGIAEACRQLGRANDVGEHDGTHPSINFRGSSTRGQPRIADTAQESLHCGEIHGDDLGPWLQGCDARYGAVGFCFNDILR